MNADTDRELERLIARYTQEFETQYAKPPAVAAAAAPPRDNEEVLDDSGSLQVRVTTENEAIPLENASVLVTQTVDGQTRLIRAAVTDANGTTEQIELPTKSRLLSLSPDNAVPYAAYTVSVTKDGYFAMRFEELPIYGGVAAIQSVRMIPLPEAAGDDVLVYPEADVN